MPNSYVAASMFFLLAVVFLSMIPLLPQSIASNELYLTIYGLFPAIMILLGIVVLLKN